MTTQSDAEFDTIIRDAIATIPHECRDALRNVAIMVADYCPERPNALGVYEGRPLPKRAAEYTNVVPDVITLYQRTLELVCTHNGVLDHEQLTKQVAMTIIHEIGHYFGLSDAELHQLGWG